ncbi:MAG: IclR family transcriptional regulator [Rhodospirillales bacterium]|nr:IclR family transcriptional regulator [Rhodospirillales bacterium]
MAHYANGSLERGAAILESLGSASEPLTLTNVAAAIDLNRPTTFRLLAVLQKLGLVHKDERTSTYALGFKVFEMGRSSRRLESIARDARPFLRQLAYDLDRTSFLSTLQGTQIVCYDKVEPPGGVTIHTSIGMRVDAHATGPGKLLLAQQTVDEVRDLYRNHPLFRHTDKTITSFSGLLAELRLIRPQGYAVDRGELLPGQQSIAIPVSTTLDQPFMAISVSGPVSGLSGTQLDMMLTRMRQAVQQIYDYRVKAVA